MSPVYSFAVREFQAFTSITKLPPGKKRQAYTVKSGLSSERNNGRKQENLNHFLQKGRRNITKRGDAERKQAKITGFFTTSTALRAGAQGDGHTGLLIVIPRAWNVTLFVRVIPG